MTVTWVGLLVRLAKNERGGSSYPINAFIVKVLSNDIEMDGCSVEERKMKTHLEPRVADTLLSSLVKVFCASPAIPTKVFLLFLHQFVLGYLLKIFEEVLQSSSLIFWGFLPVF